jgi:hypothetical protein
MKHFAKPLLREAIKSLRLKGGKYEKVNIASNKQRGPARD